MECLAQEFETWKAFPGKNFQEKKEFFIYFSKKNAIPPKGSPNPPTPVYCDFFPTLRNIACGGCEIHAISRNKKAYCILHFLNIEQFLRQMHLNLEDLTVGIKCGVESSWFGVMILTVHFLECLETSNNEIANFICNFATFLVHYFVNTVRKINRKSSKGNDCVSIFTFCLRNNLFRIFCNFVDKLCVMDKLFIKITPATAIECQTWIFHRNLVPQARALTYCFH